MLQPTIQKNDALAYALIGILSVIVFAAVVMLKKVHLQVEVGFDVHVFAAINAVINSMVSVLLIAALVFVKQKNIRCIKRQCWQQWYCRCCFWCRT